MSATTSGEDGVTYGWEFVVGREHMVSMVSATAEGLTTVCHRMFCTCGVLGHVHTLPENAPIVAMEAEIHIWFEEGKPTKPNV
ncbi:hypothetical protein ACQP25_44360 (plasmid) [Microtetraspora malaysiensis]|uniref:hypothetical protein n=1 Tax=Microtetraspora malaysiensis TaxID=161358 RepID=UPI003D8D6032